MNPYLPPLPVNEDDGFTTHDTFQVREAGEGLTNVVATLKHHAVVLLDGPWGSGKTTFARQWEGHLRKNGHAVVYWDAFQADHHEDAFFPMLAATLAEIERNSVDTKTMRDIREALHRCARKIIGNLPGIVLAGVLQLEPTTRTGKIVVSLAKLVLGNSDPTRDPSAEYFDGRLERVKAETEAVGKFKTELAKAVKTMIAQRGTAPRKQPLVFIIDELDRCKPSFALNVLERIKHVFTSDGVCFVLVTHLPELTAMARHAYGLNDAEQYLNKFYQLKIDVGALLSSGGINVRSTYLDYLGRKMDVAIEDKDNTFVRLTLENLSNVYEIQLRMLERIILNLFLYSKVNRCASIGVATHLAAALCVMRAVSSETYRDVQLNRLTFTSAARFLRLEEWIWGAVTSTALEAWWRLVTVGGHEGVEEPMAREMKKLEELFGREAPDGHPKLGALKVNNILSAISTDIDLFWQN